MAMDADFQLRRDSEFTRIFILRKQDGECVCVYVSLALYQTKIRLKKKSLYFASFSGANDVVVFVVEASSQCVQFRQ